MRKTIVLSLIGAGLLCMLLVLLLDQDGERAAIRPMASSGPDGSSADQELSPAVLQGSRTSEVVETVRAETGGGESTEPAPLEKPAEGWLRGHILDGIGNRLPRGRVEVFDRPSSIEPVAHADIEGTEREYRLLLPAETAHYVSVEPSSVEDFGVPPLVRGYTRAERDPDGAILPRAFSRARIVLAEGETIQRDFSIGRPCEVVGRLLSEDEEPLSGVLARVSGLDANNAGNAEDAVTDESGVFRFHDLFPGTYRLVFHPPAGSESFVPPIPPDLVLLDGESRDLGDMRVLQGTCTVIGSIVDQDGRPFPDLPIACYPNSSGPDGKVPHDLGSVLGRTRTGPDGTFKLSDLPAIPCKISLTPDYVPRQVVPGQPAFWEPDVEAFLSAREPVMDIGVHVVQQSRPFRLEGNLLEKTRGEHRKMLRVTVSQVGESPPDGPRRASLRREPVSVDWEEGTFLCLVETPRPGIELRLELNGYKDLVFLLQPEPGGTWSKDVLIPGDFEKQEKQE